MSLGAQNALTTGDPWCAVHGYGCTGNHLNAAAGCVPPMRDITNLWMKCVVCDEEMLEWSKPICLDCCKAIRAFRTIAVDDDK